MGVKYNIDWKSVYEDYKAGASIRNLAESLDVVKTTVSSNFKKLGLKLRTRAEAQTGKRNHQYKHGKCAKKGRVYTRKNGKKISRARLIYCEANNLDCIPEGYQVHHIDGDRTNDAISNLKLLTASEHIYETKPWMF